MATVARVLGRVSLVLVALAVLLAAAFYGFSRPASRPGESRPRSIEMEALKSSKRSRKVTICHRKGNGRYVRIRVSRDDVPGHRRHGDIVPAPRDGCPGPYGYKGDRDDRDRRERDGRRRARRQGKDD